MRLERTSEISLVTIFGREIGLQFWMYIFSLPCSPFMTSFLMRAGEISNPLGIGDTSRSVLLRTLLSVMWPSHLARLFSERVGALQSLRYSIYSW